MPKPSRGPRYAGSKKKAKKRSESQSTARAVPASATLEPVQPRQDAGENSKGAVLQFRPRARESGAARTVVSRGAAAKAFQQAVDYSYVYTDLKIIGGLSAVLFGGLIALSFVLR